MNTFLKTSALALVVGFSSQLHAQSAQALITDDGGDSTVNIVIHQKAKASEKLNIVVDGGKITINGKPVDNYTSDNVEVRKGTGSFSPDISFATPFVGSGNWNMFKNNFKRDIKSNKALLGVMTEKTDEGAKITDVTDESAADKAGLKVGDIITKLGDDKIADADDLYKSVGKYSPEDKVTITYKRGGKENTATVTLQKNKDLHIYGLNGADNFNIKVAPNIGGFTYYKGKPKMGIQVQDTEDGKGVKVLNVQDETPADKAGLEEDDIILEVNGTKITSVDDLKTAVKDGKEGDTFKVTYQRGSDTKTVDVKYPKELKTTNL